MSDDKKLVSDIYLAAGSRGESEGCGCQQGTANVQNKGTETVGAEMVQRTPTRAVQAETVGAAEASGAA